MNDNLIPAEGKHVSCPRCKARMFVRKPLVSLTGAKSPATTPSTLEPAGRDRAILDDVTGAAAVIRARCESCGSSITVPEDKKLMLCPGCGANIVRQVVEEELEPGFIESFVSAISESFSSVFKGWTPYLKRRRVKRAIGIVLGLLAVYLLLFVIARGRHSPDSILNKNIDITFNFPAPGAEPSSGEEDAGFFSNLIEITITPRDNRDREEIRVYQIIFKDGGTSDYFRYYRYDRGIVYIMLPDGSGGSYELGYEDADIRSIKRIRKVPANVKIYGVN